MDTRIQLLARIVRRKRQEANLTQANLSEKLGVLPSTLSRIERGEVAASWLFVLELCEFFQIELKEELQKEKEILIKELESKLDELKK